MSVQPKQVFDLAWIGRTRTLLVGGRFNTVGSDNRRDLAELEIPHGSAFGPATPTPMNWLGRVSQFRRVSPWPGLEGVADIDYDARDETTTVAGNFATEGYAEKGKTCAVPARRIFRLTPDMRPDPKFRLQLGDTQAQSVASSVASFVNWGKKGYVIGGNFGAIEAPDYGGPVGDLLVVNKNGSPQSWSEVTGVDQIDEVHEEGGQSTSLRALVDLGAGEASVRALLGGKVDPGQLGVDFFALPHFGIARPTAVEGTPDGSYYVAGSDSLGGPRVVRMAADGTYLGTIAMGVHGEITRLVLSSDGSYLYAGGTFKGLKAIDSEGDIDWESARDLFTAIPVQF
jgi:hypothetical protein